jgi:hypothetical protein
MGWDGLSLLVPWTQRLRPDLQAKWTTGMPASCRLLENRNANAAFWLTPAMRDEALKKTTGLAN